MTELNQISRPQAYDVVILGAGYAGLMAALRLRRVKRGLRVALIGATEQLVERVRLQETIVRPVAPRIPSISALLAGTSIDFIRGEVVALDAERRRIRMAVGAAVDEIAFDQAIYALGSRIDVDEVPGAAAHAYRLDPGKGPRAAAALRARLQAASGSAVRVVVVGGAETAIEAAGEIATAWPNAKVTMISRARCADFKGPRVERAARVQLERLGVRLIDGESVIEVRPNEVVTSADRTIEADLCVWSGGLRTAPLARVAGLAVDAIGRIFVDPTLRSISHPHIVAIGDAARPIAPTGAPYRRSAFAAIVSGAYAGDAIRTRLAGRQPRPFSYSVFGQGIAIGPGGVGFPSYPDDSQVLFILEGHTARRVRNFFVWFLAVTLKLERKYPGFFYWPGRKRVSWQQANSAMREMQPA